MKIFLLLALAPALSFAQEPKKVKIEFVEALAPKDTTSSVRYQAMYEESISMASQLLKKKLDKCGYEFETKTSFYEATDSLKAKEYGEAAQASGAWLIVGPRRSNHYLLLAQGAVQTPTVSIMASADSIKELGSLHPTVAPFNSQMAALAVREVKTRLGKAADYVSIVSSDCISCVDFAKFFDSEAAKQKIKKLHEITITGDAFDPAQIRVQVDKFKPKAILLPNYSKVSSIVMAAFNDSKDRPLFVGGDGWGDSLYGFVQNGLNITNVKGITVRGFPPFAQGLKQFPLGREVLSKNKLTESFAPDLSILKILEVTADRLCKDKPEDKTAFARSFEKNVASRISAPWGVSIFDLKSGDIKFTKNLVVR